MKTCWIVYNPASGRKRFSAALERVVADIEAMGYDVEVKPTQYPRHAIEIVKEACCERVDTLLVAGGDGTLSECVNGLAENEHRPKIAYIPSGTACDIAKTLGIPKNIDKALDIIREDCVVEMDIARSSHGYFLYVTALGNYVAISYQTRSKLKRTLGYFAYLLTGVKEFFTMPMIKTEIHHDHGVIKGYFSLILALNSRRVAGLNIIRNPVLDDGEIDIVAFRYIPFLNNLLYIVTFLIKSPKVPGVVRLRTKNAKIYTGHHRKWTIDGEAASSGNQAIEVLKRHIRIVIHEKRRRFFPND